MIQFKHYASGSSGNLYTVSDGHTAVMLECGLAWRKIQEVLKFNTASMAGVFITHSHRDHSKSAKEAARAGLDIYASKETLDAMSVPEHRRHEIADRQQFNMGTWVVMPFSTIHDVDGSLGFYMVNKEGEAFLYLTDSAYSPVRFSNLSVLACECNFVEEMLSRNILSGALPSIVGRRIRRSHFSLETLIAMLKVNDLSRCRKIYLMHLSDGNSDERRMVREVQEATGIPTEAC